ncbi:Bro-N domain-containing protein [Nocardia sp. NBC_00511]|uniref:BRO-N domain-containing protein n=1 Tax=Nocardia sp. NBC_00511 TaxID=2903591 RepID=UPI0030E03965
MTTEVTPAVFHNGEFEITIDFEDEGSFRVYAPLLAKQLGYRAAHDLVRDLDEDEKLLVKGYGNSRTPGGQGVWYVSEPGFYKVVGQRNINLIRDPKIRTAVYRFQRWIFHDVLPQMMRAGHAVGPEPGSVWSWDETAAQIRQRYGLDYKPTQLTMGMRSAGWLKAGSCTPKHEYRNHFWHTGTQYLLFPHVLPELVADLVGTMRDLGEPQAQQYQLTIFSAGDLTVLEGGAS